LVHDFYYPHVGLENHAAGRDLHHRIGIWTQEGFSWLDDGSWNISPDYYGEVLVSKIIAVNERLQVRLEFDDCVDSEMTAFMRNIHVINLSSEEREIRLFMHQLFVIGNAYSSDTVQYLPEDNAIIHYKGHRIFIVKGVHADATPFDDYTVGLFGTEGKDGTFRDAEDGRLMKNAVEHGRVDSTIAFHVATKGHSSQRIHYWIAAGRSEREARKISQTIETDGLLHHVLKTANYWAEWVKPVKNVSKKLPEQYRTSFVRSALILKSQLDKNGAVIASTDTTMLNYERDAYGYCWPRDAAYVLWPLLRLGYTEELLKYFAFARRSLHADGYLSHKYQADGAVGSSWHPYIHPDGSVAPPIQTDETALTLFLFGQYYRMHAEPELLLNFYVTLIKPMANFLASYVDTDGLPRPSYDLWEEKYLTSTYTTAVTYAALQEASYLAEQVNDSESAARWSSAADTMHDMRERFYNPSRSYFYKGYRADGETVTYDETIDSSSLFGAFMFGYFDLKDQKIVDAFETMKNTLMTDERKVIRYEDDAYRRMGGGISNPWPVTSLWFAQYALEINDTDQATKVIDWVRGAMYESGVLAEQYDLSDNPISVAPLTWSQAEYMNALLDTITERE
jgi:GH15 family glucan-1,4-alpha-glucosidase